jgi:hypothetical protein
MSSSPNPDCVNLDEIIKAAMSPNRQERDQATLNLQAIKLDATTTPILLEHITSA